MWYPEHSHNAIIAFMARQGFSGAPILLAGLVAVAVSSSGAASAGRLESAVGVNLGERSEGRHGWARLED